MRLLIKYSFLALLVLIAFSCKVSQRTTVPRNLERIYDPASSNIHPDIRIYNNSDTTSLLIERIKASELLFNQANPENKLLARMKIFYNLYDLENKQQLVDSSTITYQLNKETVKKYYTFETEIKCSIGDHYLLEIITTDLNRKNSQYSFCRINRTEKISIQDYIYYNIEDQRMFFNPYLKKGKQFTIRHYKNEIDSMRVLYFKNDFYTPPPPYEVDTLKDNITKPDTIWTCYLDSINYDQFHGEGIYFFTDDYQDIDLRKGVALFNFGQEFPKVQKPSDLAEPIQYLGTLDTISGPDSTGRFTKLAVDNFWLDKANNIDKSREILKAYYNRVMLANKFFTSYKEGWKTDRGMIYIIYGLPDYLFKSGEEERWIYNPQGIGTGIEFSFKYAENPFTFNHYVLDRDKLKVTGWDYEVEMWNNGEIIYFQNSVE